MKLLTRFIGILPITLSLLASINFTSHTNAQEGPPSLSFGLNEVLFGKGVIDVDVLATIIAEKQEELKSRIVEREILEPVYEDACFANKNYVFSVVKNLMNERDKNILKKELMEHTSNYALVYTLAEMYLELTWNEFTVDQEDKDSYFSNLCLKSPSLNAVMLEMNNELIESFHSNDYPRLKLTLTNKLKIDLTNTEQKKEQLEFNKVLIDMVFHAVRNNEVFIQKGFNNKPMYFSVEEYRTTSYFQSIKTEPFKTAMYNDVKIFVNDVASLYEGFTDIVAIMKDEGIKKSSDLIARYKEKMSDYKDGFMSEVNSLLETSKNKINENIESHKQSLIRGLDTAYTWSDSLTEVDVIRNKIQSSPLVTHADSVQYKKRVSYLKEYEEMIKKQAVIEEQINGVNDVYQKLNVTNLQDTLIARIEKSIRRIATNNDFTERSDYDSITKTLLNSLYFVKYNKLEANTEYYIKKTKSELVPKLAFLNLKSRGLLDDLLEEIEMLLSVMELHVHYPIYEKLDGDDGISRQFRRILDNSYGLGSIYLEFFSRLDKLDKLETYYYLLENLLMAGDQMSDTDLANGLNVIVQAVNKYTTFEASTEMIQVDVESIIVALHNRYGDRDKNPFNFLFTLGINNAFAFNDFSLLNSDNKPIRNFAFASEKIGLRINIANYKLKHSYKYNESKPFTNGRFDDKSYHYKVEPVVSNFHFLIYGSGLLYQLTEMSTEKNMNTAFLGAGFGLTFFNNLNFNTSLMLPLVPKRSTSFNQAVLNVGFDIYFVEYLSALNRKRKADKEAKLKAEYMLKQQEITLQNQRK